MEQVWCISVVAIISFGFMLILLPTFKYFFPLHVENLGEGATGGILVPLRPVIRLTLTSLGFRILPHIFTNGLWRNEALDLYKELMLYNNIQ